jgi:hypothetical protein
MDSEGKVTEDFLGIVAQACADLMSCQIRVNAPVNLSHLSVPDHKKLTTESVVSIHIEWKDWVDDYLDNLVADVLLQELAKNIVNNFIFCIYMLNFLIFFLQSNDDISDEIRALEECVFNDMIVSAFYSFQ